MAAILSRPQCVNSSNPLPEPMLTIYHILQHSPEGSLVGNAEDIFDVCLKMINFKMTTSSSNELKLSALCVSGFVRC